MSIELIKSLIGPATAGGLSFLIWNAQLLLVAGIFNGKILPYPEEKIRVLIIAIVAQIAAIAGFHLSDAIGLLSETEKYSLAANYLNQTLRFVSVVSVCAISWWIIYAVLYTHWLKTRKY